MKSFGNTVLEHLRPFCNILSQCLTCFWGLSPFLTRYTNPPAQTIAMRRMTLRFLLILAQLFCWSQVTNYFLISFCTLHHLTLDWRWRAHNPPPGARPRVMYALAKDSHLSDLLNGELSGETPAMRHGCNPLVRHFCSLWCTVDRIRARAKAFSVRKSTLLNLGLGLILWAETQS